MPGYAKFIKELVTKKRSMNFEMIEIFHSCSAIMTSNMVIKKTDPRAFTISCTIGMLEFTKALYDMGASRPFLVTVRALMDVEIGELKFRVNDEEVTFNVCKLMKQPSDIHVVSTIDVIDEAVTNVSEMFCVGEPLAAVFSNYDEEEVQGYDEVVAALSGLDSYSKNPLKLDIDLKN
ncbi:hypothetical protein R3W88_007776 [Solanum pinnatisectum]|uniref:Uncharacterized protein n=1 Tax=Solanum pinnatisectum TaxID=50273 RepID=A0AAV9M931_9SOLN|nr:hypothetical protein R3W88_007776 [Solanum pinnatisectum]